MHMSSPDLQSVDQLVAQGISLLKNGDVTRARVYLSEALHDAPHNYKAWLWLASAVTTNAERRYCLEQALAADATNAAAGRALATIPAWVAALPPIEFRTELHEIRAPQAAFTAQRQSEPRLTTISIPPVTAVDPLLALLPTRFSARPDSLAPAHTATLPVSYAAVPQTGVEPSSLRIVLDGFSRHLNGEQICRVLCEQHGYDWPKAEAFVLRVQREYGEAIARRQLAWFLMLGIIACIAGCYLVISRADYVYDHVVAQAIFNPRIFLSFGTGIVLLFGSLFGMGQCLKTALKL